MEKKKIGTNTQSQRPITIFKYQQVNYFPHFHLYFAVFVAFRYGLFLLLLLFSHIKEM